MKGIGIKFVGTLLGNALLVAGVTRAAGGVLEFLDPSEWQSAVGPFATIDFTGFTAGTPITDQYADLGVTFVEGNDTIKFTPSFINDDWGLDGNGAIAIAFDRPQMWMAVDHPGVVQIELYSDDVLVFTSGVFGGGTGNFLGLLSTEAFDAAVLTCPIVAKVFIDDLHFGPPPPCLGDLDFDGVVGIADFLELIAAWGPNPGHPADLDGDDDVDINDFLALIANWGPCPLFVDCNGNGVWDLLDLQGGTSADCNGNGVPDECDIADGASRDINGNRIPDECEDCNGNGVPDECDIADGTSRDINGNGIPDECEPIPNDDCEDAIVVTDGATPFHTLIATTDGPPANCPGLTAFVIDIWFLYTPPRSGIATLSICDDANFDTLLAVYLAGRCPPPTFNPLACSDNARGCGQTSEVQLLVIEGFSYLVRIGSPTPEDRGSGVLTITFEPLGGP